MIPIVRVTMWPVNGKISKDKKDVDLISMTTKTDPGEEDVEEFVKCGVVDEFYHLEEEIGRGSYGTVKKCLHKVNGNVCAAKIIKTSNNNIRKDVLREITMMRKLAHHNRIVALYDAFQTPLVITMVMEYVPGGELFELIVKEEFLMEDEAIDYVRQILEALQFMHRKNIVHLDLKPENILCVSQNESRDIKLVDFGLARQLKEGCEVKSSFGTPDFVAPEVIRMKPISTSSDMWSLGVLTYVLLSGLMPFSGEDDNHTLVKVAKADWDFDDECFDDVSEDARDFIEGLLEKEPSDRYTVDECLCHPWITHKKVVLLKIDTKKHKAWMAKRMWKKSINALVAVRRMSLSPLAANARRRSMDSALTANVPKESDEQTNTKEPKEKIQDGKNAMMIPPVTRPWRSYTDSGGSSNNADRQSSIKNMRDAAKEAVILARSIQQATKTEGSSESVPNTGLNGLTPPVLKIEDEPLVNSINTREKCCSNSNGASLDSNYDNKNNNNLISLEDANENKISCAKTGFVVKEDSTSREFDPVVLKITNDKITKVEVNTETEINRRSTQAESAENDSENAKSLTSTTQNKGNQNSTNKNEPICIHSTRTKVSQNCFFVPQKITVQLDRCSINGVTSSDDQLNLAASTNKEGMNSPPISVSVSYNMEQPSIKRDKDSIKGQSSSFRQQDTRLANNVKVRCKMDGEINWEENEAMKSGEVITVKLDSYSNLELPANQASTAHLRRASTGSPAVAFRESLLQ